MRLKTSRPTNKTSTSQTYDIEIGYDLSDFYDTIKPIPGDQNIGNVNKMTTKPSAPRNVDEYISAFPAEVQARLQKVRMTIRELVPDAQETLKYGMPVFTLNGNLIYFAAFKKHISLFPAPEGDEQFNAELAPHKAEKSTLHFPLDKPMPYDLISRIVKYRLQEHLARLDAKGKSY